MTLLEACLGLCAYMDLAEDEELLRSICITAMPLAKHRHCICKKNIELGVRCCKVLTSACLAEFCRMMEVNTMPADACDLFLVLRT